MESIQYVQRLNCIENYDLAVLGGGIAGVSAAIAAAKQGVKTCLVERFAVTGGNCTIGGVASFCGNTVGQGEVFDEIVSALEAFSAIAPLDPYVSSRIFDHEKLAFILTELLCKYNITLYLHTRFSDVISKDKKIEYCVLNGKSGLFAIKAKQFIDCTGDADVARAAGCTIMKGGATQYTLPMSLMYFVRHVDPDDLDNTYPSDWFHKINVEEELPMTSVWPNGPGSNAIKIKIPMFDASDTQSLTEAEITARRRMVSVLDYHRRVEGRSWMLDHCSPIIGIRESCRILGDYVLTVNDLRKGNDYDDSIAVGTFYLDGHKTDDDKRTYILPVDELSVPPYGIPLRCLVAKGVNNLLMAGRCISADQLAMSSARVTTTCAMTGQAAGVAAALAIKQSKSLRQIDFNQVRRMLVKNGAILEPEQVKKVYFSK